MGTLLLYAFISIVFSFLCSIWEAVILSIPASHVQMEYNSGSWVGKKLKSFKENIDRPLAAILTLNTLAHTVGAMGVGGAAAKYYADSEPLFELAGTEISMEAVIAALMTLAILILSEIIPKTLGANFWKTLTRFTVVSINAIILLLYPLVWVSQLITKMLKKDKSKSVLSRTDFSVMAEIGVKEGSLKQNEYNVIDNILRFDSIKGEDIMTPRTVVVAVPESQTVQEFYNNNKDLRFSRIPVYKGDDKDDIIGYFLKDDMLLKLAQDQPDCTVGKIVRKIQVVKDEASIGKLFNTMMNEREHIALLVDEYGGMSGIVTMEDIMETLLGLEIVDESDKTADMQKLARQKWEERAKRQGITTPDK